MLADRCPQLGARREDGVGVDVAADLAGDIGFAGKRQHERDEGRLERAVGEDGGECLEQALVLARGAARRARAQRRNIVDQQAGRQRLQRLPAIERVGVARGEEAQVVGRKVGG